jgi:GT2 family glycosyltransferase
LIVDNGSTDGSEAVLRERFSDIELIRNDVNFGFAGGNNVGISHALTQGADYVWLLNNDTVVAPDALSALVHVAEGDDRVGMVGSKIVYDDNPKLIWYAGAMLNPVCPYRPAHRGLREQDLGQYDVSEETGYVTGCSLLARCEMIGNIGLLDDRLFLYFEDVDWNVRACHAGWRLVYAPASFVRHKESISSGGAASPTVLYYMARNRLYFVQKNYPDKLVQALCYNVYEHVLVSIKKGRFSAAASAMQGIADFFSGKTGSRS